MYGNEEQRFVWNEPLRYDQEQEEHAWTYGTNEVQSNHEEDDAS